MLKKYISTIALTDKESKNSPNQNTLDFILNYSKSTEVKKNEKATVQIFLN